MLTTAGIVMNNNNKWHFALNYLFEVKLTYFCNKFVGNLEKTILQ
jgi:hypothetical protein